MGEGAEQSVGGGEREGVHGFADAGTSRIGGSDGTDGEMLEHGS